MPWKEPGKGDKDPWNSGDQQPPDLEEVFRNVSNRLRTIFGGGGGGNKKSESSGAGGMFGILLVAFCCGPVSMPCTSSTKRSWVLYCALAPTTGRFHPAST